MVDRDLPLFFTFSRISLVDVPSGSSSTSFVLGMSMSHGRIAGCVRIFDIFPVSTLTESIGCLTVNASRSSTRISGREGGRIVSSILGGGMVDMVGLKREDVRWMSEIRLVDLISACTRLSIRLDGLRYGDKWF